MAMGRREYHLPRDEREAFSGRMYLSKMRLDTGGYDEFGSYFGHCRAAGFVYEYSAEGPDHIAGTLRAHDRAQAKAIVRERYPNARFFN